MNIGDKVITGEWDGLPIWRHLTAAERLSAALLENARQRNHGIIYQSNTPTSLEVLDLDEPYQVAITKLV